MCVISRFLPLYGALLHVTMRPVNVYVCVSNVCVSSVCVYVCVFVCVPSVCVTVFVCVCVSSACVCGTHLFTAFVYSNTIVK